MKLILYLFKMMIYHNYNCCILLTLNIDKVLNNHNIHLNASRSLKFKVINKFSINMSRVKISVKRGKETKQPFEQLMFNLDSCPAY